MSALELKQISDDLQKAWADFKLENTKSIQEKTGLAIEKVEKLGSQMDSVEAKFKKLELSMATTKVLDAKAEALEKYKSAPETNYLIKGVDGMNVEQKAKLIAGDSTNGGYLVRPEFDNNIVKLVTEIDPIRQYARVTQGSGRSLIYPKRKTLVSAYWVSEQGDVKQDASTYGQGEIMTHAIAVDIPISSELMQDSFINVETELGMDAAEGFASKEGQAFLTGNNVTAPEGILTNTDVVNVDTAGSLAMVANDIFDLIFTLKTAYANNANFYGNRLVLKALRKMVGTDGQYLLNFGQFGKINFTLLGYNYVELPSMSSAITTSQAQVLMFGDLFRGYRIYDRIGMSVLRDPFTAKKQRMVEFQFEKRTGGAVVLGEALKVLKIKA